MFFFDTTYFWWVFIPTMLLSIGVQLYLKSTFSKWSKVANSAGLNGDQVAQELFDETSLDPIPIQHINQPLGDHFDPKANVVRLSPPVYGQDSVAGMAVTAHELGHVQQYQTGSGLIKARSLLLPAVTFSPTIMYACLMMGLLFNMTNMLWIGMFFFGLTVLFSLLTLPVEFDASRRALKMLDETGTARTEQDKDGARKVLTAAALTYVAAFIGSILQFFYYFRMVSQESKQDKAREQRRQSASSSRGRTSSGRRR